MSMNRIGLIFSFIGSAVLASSVKRLPSEAYQWDDRGRKIQVAGFRPARAWIGLGLIFLGFAFLLADSFIAS